MEYKSCVLKFGGSVIPDEYAVPKVAEVIKTLSSQYEIKAVVVSAMGKTTNNLDAMAHRIVKKPDLRELDALLVTGEMQSAALLSMCLNDIGNDIGIVARSYNAQQFGIYGSGCYGDGKIDYIDKPYIYDGIIPVVAGFQAVGKSSGSFLTLGREGSDITAIEVAKSFKADFCWFFKDGGGIYDKNPKKYKDAKILKKISYKKMSGLLNLNNRGQVLHKRSVQLAQEYNIPLLVSDMDLEKRTWIMNTATMDKNR